jgi:hypothetical protein
MVEKYQPDRKAVAGISPRLTIQPNDLDHDADVSNFYEAKNEISELNPLHGSTPRGTTPVPSLTEATVQPQTLSPINVPAPVVAPTPVLVPIASPPAKDTPTLSVDVSSSISHVASAPVTIPTPTERSVPSPVPTPNASSEQTLARQPSAADKLLSKYRRKSSFSVNKSPTGISATAIASQIQAEEALKGATTSGPIPPVTDHPTIAAAAAAAAKRSSATSATLPESATSPKEHATLGIAVVDTPSALVDANVTSASASSTPKKRTSFFALQSGGSPRDTKSAVVEPATPITSLLQQETNSVIPEPPLSVAVTVDFEKTVDESSKKSPTSVTPTSSTSSSTGKSFLSRYATKKRSITSGSGNNLKVELQQAKDVFAVDTASSMAPVQPEGPSPSAEQKSSFDASIHVPTIAPPPPTSVASTALHLPIDDILQSLPEIPPPSSSSHTTNETSLVPFKEESMSSPPAAVVPPPPAAVSVLAMLEAVTSPTATSLAENVNKPFADTQIEETYESESKESSIPERKKDAVDEPIPIEIVMSASSMGDYSTVPPATVGEPVSITASTPSTSALTAAAIGTAPAPASASAPVPVPAPASQDFEVEYAEKLHIASASSLMRQIASSKQGDNSPEVQQHESEKTNHYSKLGSAFVTSNVLGRGAARGGGRGRGRGL